MIGLFVSSISFYLQFNPRRGCSGFLIPDLKFFKAVSFSGICILHAVHSSQVFFMTLLNHLYSLLVELSGRRFLQFCQSVRLKGFHLVRKV
jgi:hypothetical protein